MRLGDLDDLKTAIETYDKFACLPDGKLYPIRDLKHPEMFVTYIHVEDVIKAIDNTPTVDATEEYLKGYLQGCEDTIKKVNELQKIQVHIPYGRGTKMERSEEE